MTVPRLANNCLSPESSPLNVCLFLFFFATAVVTSHRFIFHQSEALMDVRLRYGTLVSVVAFFPQQVGCNWCKIKGFRPSRQPALVVWCWWLRLLLQFNLQLCWVYNFFLSHFSRSLGGVKASERKDKKWSCFICSLPSTHTHTNRQVSYKRLL